MLMPILNHKNNIYFIIDPVGWNVTAGNEVS